MKNARTARSGLPAVEELDFPPDPATLSTTRRAVRSWAHRAGAPEDAVDDLVLAVNEAAANAILHSDATQIHVLIRGEDSRVVVEVSDDGMFRPAGGVQQRVDAGGRGLPLLLALVDEVTFSAGTERRPGTWVRMVKALAVA